jgi:hypothetical protein
LGCDGPSRGLKRSRTRIINSIVPKFKKKEWVNEEGFLLLEIEKEGKKVVNIDGVEPPRKKARR